jgi:hypothetical protein
MSRTFRKPKGDKTYRDKSVKKNRLVSEKELKRKNKSLNFEEGEE